MPQVRWLACAAVLLTACGAAEAGDPPIVDLMTSLADSSVVIRIGADNDSYAMLSRVQDAEFTPSGEHVVVLDDVAPFVRIFTRDGRAGHAFLGEGGGPGEARNPHALAASENRILIADRRHLVVSTSAGEPVATSGPDVLLPLQVLRGCSDDWIVYGPGLTGGVPLHSSEWLHSVRVSADGAISREPLLTAPSATERLGFGKPYGFTHADGRYALYHEYGRPIHFYQWRCGEAQAQVWDRGMNGLPSAVRDRVMKIDSTTEVGSLNLSEPRPSGILLIGDDVLQFLKSMHMASADVQPVDFTRIRLLSPTGDFEVELSGDYRPLSTGPAGDVLIGTDEPFPQLLIVPGDQLIALVRTHGRAIRN
ncbi:hypothetical protein BH23GEM10_BH23GEM10_10880 [soil metagenome]